MRIMPDVLIVSSRCLCVFSPVFLPQPLLLSVGKGGKKYLLIYNYYYFN